MFWEINKESYPYLSILAMKYINIPATSATIEGNFNSSTNIITNRRTNLKHNTRKELMVTKSNNKEKNRYKTKRYPDLEVVYSGEQETYFSDREDSDLVKYFNYFKRYI
jgi:hypothetical protein